MTNFWQICRKISIYTVKKHLTYEICQRKFGRVKGALSKDTGPMPYIDFKSVNNSVAQ